MNCSRAEEVSMLHDGALDPAEASRVQEHIASCEECAAFQSDLRSISGLLASEGDGVVRASPRAFKARRRLAPLAVAVSLAALVLIAILGIIVQRPKTTSKDGSVFVRYDGGGRAVIYVRKAGESR